MKRTLRILIFTPLLLLFAAFIAGDPFFFMISRKDVELKVPEGFPKPYYDFSQNSLSPSIFVLGRKLFYDTRLSSDQGTSCGTCHQRIAAFAHIDHRLSHGVFARIGKRNVPALQNLIWKDAFMWDGGVNNLEVQAVNPITNPAEMDETLENVLHKIRQDSSYRNMFSLAFGDTLINSQRVLKALTQFTGLMISADARYDRCMTGRQRFTAEEKKGLRVFRDQCASCHKEPLFSDNSYCSNGLKADTALMDEGRYLVTAVAADRFRFKVPGLRNILLTYPYMHDGRFSSLEEVLNHYASLDEEAKKADRRLQKIRLSAEDKRYLLVFLSSLTDKTFLYDRRFADPSAY